MKNLTLPIGVFILAVLAGIAIMVLPGKNQNSSQNTNQPATTTSTTAGPWTYKDVLTVEQFDAGAVKSPLTLRGMARGWYFEASFPIELRNASGTIIAQAPAQAQSDWMVSTPVAYSITLTFPTQPSGSTGTLILRKDNPSGLPENDDSYSIPVIFQ